ncbi:hypothetical protein CF327_g1331 [Tilletia walkeri]|nr:hypothetical protein CF327_g1331 [Tilletia walkeri]
MRITAFSFVSVLTALSTVVLATKTPLEIRRMNRVRFNALSLAERGVVQFNFSTTTVRGVNLAGWLVLEPWVTPSIFSAVDSRVVDEWTFGQYVPDAKARLQQHWATWVTERTFRQIAAVGYLNMVRIPIGYWCLDVSMGEPYVRADQLDYLTKAVGWAKQYGLKVMIDLHGVPGSQNGFDNSGQRLDNNTVYFNANATNAARAEAVLVTIAKRFSTPEYSDTVVAIELLNEPGTSFKTTPNIFAPSLLKYYRTFLDQGYYYMRQNTTPGQVNNALTVTVHDGFQNLSYWEGAFSAPKFTNVVLDTHRYSMFVPGANALSPADRLQSFCNLRTELSQSQKNVPTVIGEWTTAPNDCAQWLNVRGRGSRYEGQYEDEPFTGPCYDKTFDAVRFSPDYKALLKAMFDTQTKLYEETTSGWIMWAWRTESAPEWSFKAGLKGGWIPSGSLGNRSSAVC